jgi:hypothetical protein
MIRRSDPRQSISIRAYRIAVAASLWYIQILLIPDYTLPLLKHKIPFACERTLSRGTVFHSILFIYFLHVYMEGKKKQQK